MNQYDRPIKRLFVPSLFEQVFRAFTSLILEYKWSIKVVYKSHLKIGSENIIHCTMTAFLFFNNPCNNLI